MLAHDFETPAHGMQVLTPARRRAVLDVLGVAFAAVVGAYLALAGVTQAIDTGPLTLGVRLSAGMPGQTVLKIPPFGEVSANTHTGPLRLVFAVESINVAGVEDLLSGDFDEIASLQAGASDASATVSEAIAAESGRVVRRLVNLALGTALVAASVAGLVALVLRRRARIAIVGAAVGFALVAGSAGLAAATFDPAAIASPHLEGAIAYVPELQTVLSARISSIEQLRSQAARAVENIAAYYADTRSIVAGGGLSGTYRVLHVTDLHLDPVGAEFARSLVRSYEASLVVDTGDISIGGTAEESALLSSLVITSTPVIFVPGNHDSEAVADALAALPNYTVATSATVTVDGLTVFPIPDPASRSGGIEPDQAEVERVTREAIRRLDGLEDSGLPRPDIIAQHNPGSEGELAGRAALIVSGHTHAPRLYRDELGIRLNSGTTGGMPYDPEVTGRRRRPHSASVLYYTAGLPRRLIAIDLISIGVQGTTSLDRTVIDEMLVP